ncbi:MAG: hypothetical protein ACR2M0_05395 [Chloroflexia bacterium]
MPYFYGLLLLTGLLVAGVYQIGGAVRWEMHDASARAYLVNFYGAEQSGTLGFRWAAPQAGLRVPGLGSFPGLVHLTLNGDPWGGPPRTVTVTINADPPASSAATTAAVLVSRATSSTGHTSGLMPM